MAGIPPFRSLLKSREVEDPINLSVNRPLAYLFVCLVYRTPMTPNQVTVLAMVVGICAGACWVWGTATGMLVGGILLWTSAILDGADGILARAKGMQSPLGRALDGAADMVVAIATIFPAAYRIWQQTNQDILYAILAVPAILTAVWHISLYDFYKELYLRNTRPGRGGEGEDIAKTKERIKELREKKASWVVLFAMERVLLPFMEGQQRLIQRTNGLALQAPIGPGLGEAGVEPYRANNRGPMRLWTYISLAPHNYLLAICGMIDRLDLYLWIRLVGMNGLFIIALIWQRKATKATLSTFERLSNAEAPAPG